MPHASQIYPIANIKIVNLTCPMNAIAFQSAYHQHSGERYRTNGPLVFRFTDNTEGTKHVVKYTLVHVYFSSAFTVMFTLSRPLNHSITNRTSFMLDCICEINICQFDM